MPMGSPDRLRQGYGEFAEALRGESDGSGLHGAAYFAA